MINTGRITERECGIMEHENPYKSPEFASPAVAEEEYHAPEATTTVRTSAISTGNTIFPRYIAANFDAAMAAIFMLVALKANPLDYRLLHVVVAVVAFLAYYFIFEALFARTPGKLLMGLVVRKFDGTKCGWREAVIRTGLRVVELNPIFLGGLPACVIILFSKNRQRLGDIVADTVVVLACRIPRD